MSMSSTSTTMFRRVLLGARLGSVSEACGRTMRPAAFAPSRSVSSAARLPTLTASETRRRPTVRPHQQSVASSGVNALSPTSKRTIFIQTENTPNPDVSLFVMNAACIASLPHMLTCNRPSNSFQTTASFQRKSPLPSSNT